MNVTQATRLVAEREIRVKLRDRTFLFGTLFFLLIAAAGTILPPLFSGGPSTVAVDRERWPRRCAPPGWKSASSPTTGPPSRPSATTTWTPRWSPDRPSWPWTTPPTTWCGR